MKRSTLFPLIVCILCVTSMHSQEQEFERFRKAFHFYIDFTIGRFDSLPVNAVNQKKISKQVDDAFKAFVNHPHSHEYEKLIVAKGNDRDKFVRLDGRGELHVTTFKTSGKPYLVYGYSAQPKKNYVVKDADSNTIVYEGNTNDYIVDGIYPIDATHMLLVQRDGDYHTSRSAVVLAITDKGVWKTTKSFSGNAFGQVPGEYRTKKFVKNRTYFQLECDFSYTMGHPADINQVSFDTLTNTLSYKQYYENKKPVIVSAKWENNLFVIDDYDVGENLSRDEVGVPR